MKYVILFHKSICFKRKIKSIQLYVNLKKNECMHDWP